MSILHHRSHETRPSVFPRQSNLEMPAGIGNGGPTNPGDFNDKNGDDDPRRRVSRRRALAIGGGILATAGIAASAFVLGGGGKNNNAAPTHETTTSAPATTEPSETAPTPTTIESPAPTQPTPELITPSNPELLTALENMTPEEFEQQPLEARMLWVVSHLQDEAENATSYLAFSYTDPKTDEIKSYTFKDGSEMARHNPIANLQDPTSGTELTRFSSPDDVLYYDLTVRNLSGASITNNEFDQDKSRKWISANVADPKSAEYQDRVDSVEHSNKATALQDDLLHKYDVDGGTPLYKTTVEGKSYEAMTIEYSYGGGKAKAEYIFVPRTEMGQTEDGKQKGIWLQTKEVVEQVKPITPVQ